jgi:formate--tetrahydrofolate ligase
MASDIEIARAAKKRPISEVAARLGIPAGDIIPYGHDKAKVSARYIKDLRPHNLGKLILVTAINPTAAGEGKTTTSVGLADALSRIGEKTMLCLREPSLGPCFGMKGGATGGGLSQVVPMDEINLHFTGDFHAITSAHNLLAAMVDNHIHWNHEPRIDPRRKTWRRVMDMNDRSLRNVVSGLGGPGNGSPSETGFDITVASEVMAILCLAKDAADLEARLARIIVGYTRERAAVTAADIKAVGAMMVLLKDAMQPNLVQTLENNPAFIHGGPFANIAHGLLRRRPRRREIPQHQVPASQSRAGRRRSGGNRPGAEDARRPHQGRPGNGQLQRARIRARKPWPAYREPAPLRPAGRRRHQPVHHRHLRRDLGHRSLLRQARGRGGALHPLGRRRTRR